MVSPYLKGLVIIKCGFFYLACGSIMYSVFVLIISSDLVLVLNRKAHVIVIFFITLHLLDFARGHLP
jgi:hypothetical protein